MDGRSRAKVPYGYRIVNGRAEIDPAERDILLGYFEVYLSGEPMSYAAEKAGLPFSSTTYPHLFKRKEYLGTDFYPAIITPEKQRELLKEWEARKGERPRMAKPAVSKGVRIYTDFRLVRARRYEEGDPVDCAAALYQRIRPRTDKTRNAQVGK